MASLRLVKLSERAYWLFYRVGVDMTIYAIVMAIARVITTLMNWNCPSPTQLNEPSQFALVSTCAVTGLYMPWIVMLVASCYGILLVVWALGGIDYYYRQVVEGEVIGFSWESSSHFGLTSYTIHVVGTTRHGDVREYEWPVSPKTNPKYEIGDEIDFT